MRHRLARFIARFICTPFPLHFRITDWSRERRTPAQLALARRLEQDRLDLQLEQLWRRRVQANLRRRAREQALPQDVCALLQRQAS